MGYNETRLFNVLETWFLAAIVLRRWDDLAAVSHALGNVIMPGDPAYGVLAPAKPLQLEAVCGPRKPGHASKQRAKATEEPKEQTTPAQQRRYKAPPPYERVQVAPAGPPPAATTTEEPGGTGSYADVAKGATSKTGQSKTEPPGGWRDEVKDEQRPPVAPAQAAAPARLPAEEADQPVQTTSTGEVTVQEQQELAAKATEQQLPDVPRAAQLLEASGFALTRSQQVAIAAYKSAVEAKAATQQPPPEQWAGYRPEHLQHSSRWGGGYSSWQQQGQSWTPDDWGQEADETGYGPASEHHPQYHQHPELPKC
eukprot:6334762-Amphidinium_carterae.1